MKSMLREQTALAEAVTEFIERFHQKFSGIRIRSITPYEDEDFALEIIVPTGMNTGEVEEFSLQECISLEDRYEVYLLTKVSLME